ncbi:MAG TPA: methyltransferase domain-containing protein [Caulobacteraceae bacterium]
MNPFRYRAVVEADHVIQNPTSPEKLRRVIDYLRLKDGDRVVDVGCGKGWLLRAMAAERRIDAVGLEINPAFAAEARRAAAEASLAGKVQIVEAPALDHVVADGQFDVALCIGATFALGDFESAVAWMARAVGPTGRIAVGEPYVRRMPFPEAVRARWSEYDRDLAGAADVIARNGLVLTGLVEASQDDWDHYEGQHWRASTAWIRANPDDPDVDWLTDKIESDRRHYLNEERGLFGWAIFIAEKAPS